MGILVNAALCFGLVAGSFSIGSLFLRIGWPKVKIIDEEYRRGWALAIGLIFSFAVIFGSLFLWFAVQAYGYAQYLLLVLLAGFVTGIIITTAKRKLSSVQKVKVEIPKERIASSAASEKAVEMLQGDRKFIKVARMEEGKLAKLREKLGVAGQEETAPVPEEKNAVEEAPEASIVNEVSEEKAESEDKFSPGFSEEKAEGEEAAEGQKEDSGPLADWEPEKSAEDEIMAEVKKEVEKEKADKAAEKIAKAAEKPAEVKAPGNPARPAEKIPDKEAKEKVIGEISEVKKKLREAFAGKEEGKKKKEDVSLDWPDKEKEEDEEDDDKLSPLQELLKKKKKEIGIIKKRM